MTLFFAVLLHIDTIQADELIQRCKSRRGDSTVYSNVSISEESNQSCEVIKMAPACSALGERFFSNDKKLHGYLNCSSGFSQEDRMDIKLKLDYSERDLVKRYKNLSPIQKVKSTLKYNLAEQKREGGVSGKFKAGDSANDIDKFDEILDSGLNSTGSSKKSNGLDMFFPSSLPMSEIKKILSDVLSNEPSK